MSGFFLRPYEHDFSYELDRIIQAVDAWLKTEHTNLDIDRFVDCVYLKRASHEIAFVNAAYELFYGPVDTTSGPFGDRHLDKTTLSVENMSDDLVCAVGRSVEYEHVSRRADGEAFELRTHKRCLPLSSHGVTILGVTRVLSRVDVKPVSTADQLAAIARKYESLDADYRALCCLMAAGHSQREMAELLGCTTRTIENRRNRIMEELGASKPIDIVKIMVRLAEHGLISADF